MSSGNICVIGISADKSDDVHDVNSSGSHCESLSFLDGLLDLASTFSQPQKNELLTPELYGRAFNKAAFVLTPPTPTLQVRVEMFLNVLDMENVIHFLNMKMLLNLKLENIIQFKNLKCYLILKC